MEGVVRKGWRWGVACAGFLLTLTAAVAWSAPGPPVGFAVTLSGSAEDTLRKYQPLADYLSKKTGRPFELRIVRKYEDILDLMKAGKADVGVFGSIAGSDAFLGKMVVPVARPEKGGVSTYRGFLIVRKESGTRKVEDLKGKSFDSAASASVGGFFPKKLLRDRKADFPSFFSRVTTSPKHEAVVYKVLNGEADCGTVKDSVFEKLARSDPRVKKELVILATSQRFPDGNVMIRNGADAGFIRSVGGSLLGMESDREAKPALEAIGAERFLPSSGKEFESLGKAANSLEKKRP